MKFALLELKIGLVKLIQNFLIQATPNTPDELEYEEGLVRLPKNGIKVIFKKRICLVGTYGTSGTKIVFSRKI